MKKYLIIGTLLTLLFVPVTPVNAINIQASDSCDELFTVNITNQLGVNINADLLSVDLFDPSLGWESARTMPFGFLKNATGKFTICNLNANDWAWSYNDLNHFENTQEFRFSYKLPSSTIVATAQHLLTDGEVTKLKAHEKFQFTNLKTSENTQVSVLSTDDGVKKNNDAQWFLTKWFAHPNSPNFFSYAAGKSDSTGEIKVNGLPDGKYQIEIYPNSTASSLAVSTKNEFTVAGGVANFAANDTVFTSTAVKTTLKLALGNFRVQVTDAPVGSNTPISVATEKSLGSLFDSTHEIFWDGYQPTYRGNGIFTANLTEGNAYTFNIGVGPGSGFMETQFGARVDANVTSLTQNSESVPMVHLIKATFAFKAFSSDGVTPLESANFDFVKVSELCPDIQSFGDEFCLMDESSKFSTSTNENGIGAIKLPEDNYLVLFMPNLINGISFGDSPTLSKIKIGANGYPVGSTGSDFALIADAGASVSTTAAALPGLNTLKFVAQKPNFEIHLTDQNDHQLAGGNFSISLKDGNCNPGTCISNKLSQAFSQIDSNGKAAIYLPPPVEGGPAIYNLSFEPSTSDQSAAAPASLEATVSIASPLGHVEITAPVNTEGNFSIPSESQNFWTYKLPAPNLQGRVLAPIGSTTVPYVTMWFEFWDERMSPPSYQPVTQNGYLWSRQDGTYAGSFASGKRYRVNLHSNSGSYADASYEILKDESGATCFYDEGSSQCITDKSDSMDFRLAAPNLSVQIMRDGYPIAFGTHEELFANLRGNNSQMNSVVSTDGVAGFSITTPGLYELDIEPWGIDGYATTKRYYKAEGTEGSITICQLPGAVDLSDPDAVSCSGQLSVQPFEVPLQPTNAVFSVQVPTSFEGSLWGGVYQVDNPGSVLTSWTMNSSITFKKINETTYQGAAFIDSRNGSTSKFEIMLDSQAKSTSIPLTRKVFAIWAKNFDGEAGNEFCLDSNYADGECSSPISPAIGPTDTNISTELGYGNLQGMVVDPEGNPVAYPDVQISQWKQSVWSNGEFGWVNSNGGAASSAKGRFAASANEPGFYQIRVNQGWGVQKPYSATVYTLEVSDNPDHAWCIYSGDFKTHGATDTPLLNQSRCSTFTLDNKSDDISGLTLSLTVPNTTGAITNSNGSLARNAWVSVEKYDSVSGSYQYEMGSSANYSGRFYLNIENGDYRLRINPPWDMRDLSSQTLVYVCVGSQHISGSGNLATCATKNNLNIKLPGPNFAGSICSKESIDPICTAAKYGYLYAQPINGNNSPGGWAQIDGRGKFALRLDEGDYKLSIYTSDTSSNGIFDPVTISVTAEGCTVDGIAKDAFECISQKFTLQNTNINGTLTYTNTSTGTSGLKMANSWINVYTSSDEGSTFGNWVTSTTTNTVGKFSLNLSNGEYVFTATSNSQIANKSLLTFRVKVAGNSVAFKYSPSADVLFDTPAQISIAADFDAIQPNVKIEVPSTWATSRLILIKDLSDSNILPSLRINSNPSSHEAEVVLPADKLYEFIVIPIPSDTDHSGCVYTMTNSDTPIVAANSDGTGQVTFNLSTCRVTQ